MNSWAPIDGGPHLIQIGCEGNDHLRRLANSAANTPGKLHNAQPRGERFVRGGEFVDEAVQELGDHGDAVLQRVAVVDDDGVVQVGGTQVTAGEHAALLTGGDL